jgi:hypothetical protein
MWGGSEQGFAMRACALWKRSSDDVGDVSARRDAGEV